MAIFSFPLLLSTTFFLVLLFKANSSDTIDFTFSTFTPTHETDLILQGNATISPSNTLQLTTTDNSGNPKKNSVGRALYSVPVHLWENDSSNSLNISTFETTFEFVIKSPTREVVGDGITFFLAPIDTTIPDDSDGGFFGLFSNNTLSQSSSSPSNQILAVEFDTYIDGKWDPNYRHIGIDVHSVRSQAETKWDRISGAVVTTTIKYNPFNQKLYVYSFDSSTDNECYVSASIDLASVLPEWVRVGFSASTGDSAVETHEIISWSFSSWLNFVSLAKKEDKYVSLSHDE